MRASWPIRCLAGAALLLSQSVLTQQAQQAPQSERHWAFQPIRFSHPPEASNGRSVRNPVDAFIAARLKEQGLAANPEANGETLLRRLFFVLTGLPPAPDDLDLFLGSSPEHRYERWVEKLLESPRFGERWARHWLDVVRYTESQGFEYDKLRDNAWHYRDYVIQSFNADKPYDQFMREQVAGDVLDPASQDSIAASSLLVCGAWDEAGNSQANVAQRMTTREEELEDLLSVVGQTFLGLTMNCARCHDHKFDPISQRDYFGMKSVFDGVKHGERSLASRQQLKQHDDIKKRLRAEIQEMEQELGALEAEGARQVLKSREPGGIEPLTSTRPAYMSWSFAAGTQAWSGKLVGGAKVSEGRLQLPTSGAYLEAGETSRELREKTLEAWVSLNDLSQGGGAALSIESEGGRYFDALVYGERQPRKWTAGSDGFARTRDLDAPPEATTDGAWIHMVAAYANDGQITLYRNGRIYGKPWKPSEAPRVFPAGSRILLGMRHTGGGKPFLTGSILRAALHDRALGQAEVEQLYTNSPAAVSMQDAIAALSIDLRREHRALTSKLDTAREQLSAIAPLPVSYAGLREQPAPTRLLKRGDVRNPSDTVSPAALPGIAGFGLDFGLPPDAPEADRRIHFARWLTSPTNPLPARVMVNRVWHYMFGRGLVATPSDFGKAGTPPTHPELLDWLASEFIRSGWSVKSIVRTIALSATFRMSSQHQSSQAAVDAESQFLWRFPPRRLEAEAIRDSMLAVSGDLNLKMGGPSFRPFEVIKFPVNSYEPQDKLGPEYNRRGVYRMNVNSGKDPLLDVFDCPDPSIKAPRRGSTSTPLQALGLMNNSFVNRQAKQLAERIKPRAGEDVSQAIERAYRVALGRKPTGTERLEALETARDRGLFHVCWALLNSTEFVFLR
ncbi:MAG: DUF1553 domain-containing protein [Verrucomicrobia bacterium]|nr:DUF1553 domain-containing protein [Verrucomicrobiota bacterium]